MVNLDCTNAKQELIPSSFSQQKSTVAQQKKVENTLKYSDKTGNNYSVTLKLKKSLLQTTINGVFSYDSHHFQRKYRQNSS